MSKVQRQATITRIIGDHEVTSQPQLIELLAEHGIEVRADRPGVGGRIDGALFDDAAKGGCGHQGHNRHRPDRQRPAG